MGSDRSLTDPPNNLKEAIDWMVRISFLDKSRNLKNAVEKLENFTQATQGLGNFTVEGVEGLFNYVAKALKTLIGYNTGGGEALTGNGIGRKDHSPYTSSYSDSAKWDGNLNTPGSEGAKKVALIFLCYVPILYLGVTYLFWQCSNTQSHVGWKSLQLRSSSSALYLFMSSMGFDMQALQDKSGSDIAKLMEDQLNGFDDFKNVSKAEYSYSSFLQKLEQKHGRDKLNANAINSPLHSLYLASTAYVKYRFNGGEGVDATFVEIRGKLQTFKASFNSDPDLKDEIDNFISTCMTTPRKPEAPSQPSPAGPAAGGLVGVGALGAGVAYGLNLEAIDWILRVTGKDGGGGGGTSQLANAVSTLLKDVKSSSPELEEKFDEIKKALYSGPNNGIIGGLGTGLEKFKEGIKSQGYNVNVYQTLTGNNLNDVPNAAKIFLGCVPLCFYSLSYLYWRCSDGDVKNGGWKTQTLTTEYLGYFMNAHGFNSKQLSDKQGTRVVSEAMKDKFEDFKEGISTAKGMAEQRANKEDEARTKLGIGDAYVPDFRTGTPSTKVAANKNPTYPEYLHALCGKWCNGPSAFTPSDDKPLSSIYYICRLYFQGKQKLQSDLPNLKPRPPTTIREMLYFLAALPFSPSYDAFDKYLTRHFTSLSGNSDATYDAELMIPVADSASVNTNNTLSAADLKDYLTNTCHYSTTILSVIQGNSGSENPGEPWLHELYSNGLRFTYPPDSGLFSTLSNYTYALQFQLYFLFTQCAGTYSEGCGWNQCTYGSEMNKNLNTAVLSHICTGFKCNGASGCRHNGGSTNLNCKHNKLKDAESCGQSNGSLSPLQAFLTDKLKGFSLYDKPDTNSPSHLSDHPPGFMCHVKMGFTPQSLRSNARKGNYIYRVLEPFCGNSHSPLRQLSEKLGCLTKRTPRTLGDLFGFTWHLNGQLFKYRPKLKTLIGKFLNDFGIQNLIPSTTSNPYLSITELWKKNFRAELNFSVPSKSHVLRHLQIHRIHGPSDPVSLSAFHDRGP
ncbi:uncharacterized protein BcabD6B2_53770 [Babesia caballi]|uniref:Uncharacterized protein n=1 Tax=Babesia caballi TaxID=5871 RepID=A0AAV4M1J1_BABCB|nr:hypothetical protein, conserved [Babesia caballi]